MSRIEKFGLTTGIVGLVADVVGLECVNDYETTRTRI
jgi:hypothetical protein